MTRKPSVATLRRKADKLLQQAFVSNHPVCLICQQPTSCGHHYIYKSKSSFLRYEMNNLISLCAKCHMKHHFSGDPRIVQIILEKKGAAWANDLQKCRRIPCRLNKTYLRKVIERLESLKSYN